MDDKKERLKNHIQFCCSTSPFLSIILYRLNVIQKFRCHKIVKWDCYKLIITIKKAAHVSIKFWSFCHKIPSEMTTKAQYHVFASKNKQKSQKKKQMRNTEIICGKSSLIVRLHSAKRKSVIFLQGVWTCECILIFHNNKPNKIVRFLYISSLKKK